MTQDQESPQAIFKAIIDKIKQEKFNINAFVVALQEMFALSVAAHDAKIKEEQANF